MTKLPDRTAQDMLNLVQTSLAESTKRLENARQARQSTVDSGNTPAKNQDEFISNLEKSVNNFNAAIAYIKDNLSLTWDELFVTVKPILARGGPQEGL